MRILFFGTPGFASASLEALLRGPDDVVGVVTQPDRRRGRGLKTESPDAARVARAHGLPLFQPDRLYAPDLLAELRALGPDLGVTAAFGRILKRSILDLPHRGCLNVHASLLPRHRGASPISRAILEGDAWTGITIFRLDEGMDTGPILVQRTEPIRPEDTQASLGERLATLGGEVLLDACAFIRSDTAVYLPQEESCATYAPILRKDDGVLSFRRPAEQIERQVRAMHPWPGTTTTIRDAALRVAAVEILDAAPSGAEPGTVLSCEREVIIAAQPGRIRLKRVQAAGKREVDGIEWARGARLQRGERFA